MDRIFIYWDDSKILQEGRRLAEERDDWPGAGNILHINRDALLKLAHADRPVQRATWVGPSSEKMRNIWSCLDASGVEVFACEDKPLGANEKKVVPSYYINERMMLDSLKYCEDPGTIVLLTGDGLGYMDSASCLPNALKTIHEYEWRIEILSWANFCDQRMRQWAEKNGIFVALEDFYEPITYLKRPDTDEAAPDRESAPLDLSLRSGHGIAGLAGPATGVQQAAARP